MEFRLLLFLGKPVWMWLFFIALYFARAAVIHRFRCLKLALSLVLVFIGSKIFVADLTGWEKFPANWSLMITFAILAAGVVFSPWKTRWAKPTAAE